METSNYLCFNCTINNDDIENIKNTLSAIENIESKSTYLNCFEYITKLINTMVTDNNRFLSKLILDLRNDKTLNYDEIFKIATSEKYFVLPSNPKEILLFVPMLLSNLLKNNQSLHEFICKYFEGDIFSIKYNNFKNSVLDDFYNTIKNISLYINDTNKLKQYILGNDTNFTPEPVIEEPMIPNEPTPIIVKIPTSCEDEKVLKSLLKATEELTDNLKNKIIKVSRTDKAIISSILESMKLICNQTNSLESFYCLLCTLKLFCAKIKKIQPYINELDKTLNEFIINNDTNNNFRDKFDHYDNLLKNY